MVRGGVLVELLLMRTDGVSRGDCVESRCMCGDGDGDRNEERGLGQIAERKEAALPFRRRYRYRRALAISDKDLACIGASRLFAGGRQESAALGRGEARELHEELVAVSELTVTVSYFVRSL